MGKLPHKVVGDLAQLDWLIHESYYTSDHRALEFADLAVFLSDLKGVRRLSLVSSFRLMKTFWNLEAIFDHSAADPSSLREQRAENLLGIWKHNGVVQKQMIEPEIVAVVETLSSGLGAAELEAVFCTTPEASQLFTEFLSIAVQRQWLMIG